MGGGGVDTAVLRLIAGRRRLSHPRHYGAPAAAGCEGARAGRARSCACTVTVTMAALTWRGRDLAGIPRGGQAGSENNCQTVKYEDLHLRLIQLLAIQQLRQ